jgi:hypothetical protein
MNNLHSHQQSRRDAMRAAAAGLGFMALPRLTYANPLVAKAKRVIFLCMSGAPSHLDTFDYKPQLSKWGGKDAPSKYRAKGKLLASPFKFQQHGQSGLWISGLFPHLAEQADRLCLLHGMQTDIPAHSQASIRMHTGNSQFVRPSMGAWVHYGLGSANPNLPAFVTLNPPAGQGGAQNYGSAFLPPQHQGLRIGIERESRLVRRGLVNEPVANITNKRRSPEAQRRQLDLVAALNKQHSQRGDPNKTVESVIEANSLAYRMQTELPNLLDTTQVPSKTLKMYGIGEAATDAFGRQCLIARNLAEQGVRFIEVNQGGWDHHRNLTEDLKTSCTAIDQPIAALLKDLDRTGLLKETLVIWGGEFGRSPIAQGSDGRGHNNRGYTTWMAGAGVKGGISYGQTDELGFEAVEGQVSTHDWHATVLHLLGLDHTQLTFNHAGRDFRLTDVAGEVIGDILA